MKMRTEMEISPFYPRQIVRLLLIVLLAVHFFACAFWRVASSFRTPEEMDTWLAAKHVPADVSLTHPPRPNRIV